MAHMDHTLSPIGTVIRDAAVAKGISIRQLARDAAIARETLNRKMAGGSEFTVPELMRIARIVGAHASAWVTDLEAATR